MCTIIDDSKVLCSHSFLYKLEFLFSCYHVLKLKGSQKLWDPEKKERLNLVLSKVEIIRMSS